MAWELVAPSVKGRSINRSARVTLALRKTSGRSRCLVVATLGGDVATELGWRQKDRVMIERDPQAGLLRITKMPEDADQTFTLNGKKESPMVFVCFTLAGLPETKAYLAKPVEHRVDRATSALVLTLPDWARVSCPTPRPAAPPTRDKMAPLPVWAEPAMKAPLPRGMVLDDETKRRAIQLIVGGETTAAVAMEIGQPIVQAGVFVAAVQGMIRRPRDAA